MRPDRLLPLLFRGAAHPSAVIVEPNARDRALVASMLASVGFTVKTANNFSDAKAVLMASPPMLLVAEIRLGAYNSLHLALRGKSMRPEMTTVLTSRFADPVLQRDAEEIGATFVLKPVTAQELLAAVCRTTAHQPNLEGMFDPVRPPFERRALNRRRRSDDETLSAERRLSDRRRGLPWHELGLCACQ